MIPKRIYQVWFNKNGTTAIPGDVLKYIKHVQQWCLLHGYEYVLIDNNSELLKECMETSTFCKRQTHRPVALSDYVRLYALNKYGGIYLDTDVLIKEGFDKFLEGDYFIGYENSEASNHRFHRFDVGTFGSAPNNEVLTKLMWLMDTYLWPHYLNCGLLNIIIPNIPKEDSRYYNNGVWYAIPDMFPFVINVLLGKEILYNYKIEPLKFDDPYYKVYDIMYFSSGGKYTEHMFNTKWD